MNEKIAEKYFANQTTPYETQKVLEWFETPEGKKFLLKKIEADSVLMENSELRELVHDIDSDTLFNSISTTIDNRSKTGSVRRTDWLGHFVRAAAVILVVASATWITLTLDTYQAEQIVEREPVHLFTGDEQHREITLNDGSVVRLNRNSEIVVSKDFMEGTREVTLSGEAYFDIRNIPDQPFIIHANESSVEVLGTEFNVRSIPSENNVQVAVVDGSVAFKNVISDMDSHEVVLNGGQYGYMDIEARSIIVEEIAIDNYLAWKSGRFVFEDLKLSQVCDQLNRLYHMECAFNDDELKDIPLTANFSNESKEKTLSVIALTLDIEFEKQNNVVNWKN